MLDVVNRADKAAFDAQVLHSGIPLDLEKAGNLLSAGSNAPGLGSASVIVGLADFIARHRGADPKLEHMTDKHFFRESEVSLAATTAGFRSVQFMNVAQPDFYTAWMPYFLDIYGVTHQKVRHSAITQYDRAAALAGPLLPELMSHFKYIVLQKSC